MSWRHIDLFSGAISGFSFAASQVWPNCEHVALCEVDPWRRKQLGRLWPGVPIIEDINDEEQIAAYTDSTIDLATLSPPCQSSSCAGRKLGTRDTRWLWPQALRAVEITKPRWCIFENPTGFLSIDKGMAYESVCADLEGKGYWVEGFIIPASAVGAWHRRDRVWIIAHVEEQPERAGLRPGEPEGERGRRPGDSDCEGIVAADPDQSGPQIREMLERNFRTQFQAAIRDSWTDHWLSAIRALCSLVHAGGRPRKGSGIEADRTKWIAALGDSIVPQVPMQIMQAIKTAGVDTEDN